MSEFDQALQRYRDSLPSNNALSSHGNDSLGNWLSNALGVGSGNPSNAARGAVDQNAANAAGFAGQAQGNYNANQAGINQSIQALRDQAAGKTSVSAEQLRQGMLSGQAAQQSMAAGASPNNQAMAARTAQMNMGRLGYGLSGQQAVAGLQERNQAQQALAQLQLGQSGQNLQGTLGGYGAANQGYGAELGNPQKTWGGLIGGAIGGLASSIPGIGKSAPGGGGGYTYGGNDSSPGNGGGWTYSDRRLKTDVKDGDSEADRAIEGLRAYAYDYKDEKNGKGRQFGVMAQDLEKAGLKHTVIDTPRGKIVDGAKAATSSLALVAALGRRVSKLEGK